MNNFEVTVICYHSKNISVFKFCLWKYNFMTGNQEYAIKIKTILIILLLCSKISLMCLEKRNMLTYNVFQLKYIYIKIASMN